ncbi:hypothetical protein STXM2123_883 [Streptomyces sp. F-3]|nr:hypothetical protein STXM2123_883 [Streptomyces sp. F-3]
MIGQKRPSGMRLGHGVHAASLGSGFRVHKNTNGISGMP